MKYKKNPESVVRDIKRETMKLRRAYNLRKGGLKKHMQFLKTTP